MATQDRLDYLRVHRAEKCEKCRLHKRRTHVVFGEGNPDADLVLVGEAPGEQEDLSGRPFVGDSGQLLRGLLRRAGLTMKEVYIANVVKCRPPDNRVPEEDEIEACSPFLHTQLRIIRPQVVVALGNFAGCLLTGEDQDTSVGYLREHAWRYENYITGIRVPLVCTYHPAWLVRQLNGPTATQSARAIMADLEKAKGFLSSS
jgi:DNA polymerase